VVTKASSFCRHLIGLPGGRPGVGYALLVGIFTPTALASARLATVS
jgi:hypothetical protein